MPKDTTKYVQESLDRYGLEGDIDDVCSYLQKLKKEYEEKGWSSISIDLTAEDQWGSEVITLSVCGYVEMTEEEKKERKERDKLSKAARKMGMSDYEYSLYLKFKEKGLVKDV